MWRGTSSIVFGINIFNIELIIITYNRAMSKEIEEVAPHKKYSKISLKKRQILIQMVIQNGESLTKTAKKLNIKLSTAKLILRKYRKTGVLFNKNMSARVKKNEKNANKSMQNAQQSQLCKQQQQLQSPHTPLKEEEESEEHLPSGMVVPTVYYPAYQGNWMTYPWYSYAFHL